MVREPKWGKDNSSLDNIETSPMNYRGIPIQSVLAALKYSVIIKNFTKTK